MLYEHFEIRIFHHTTETKASLQLLTWHEDDTVNDQFPKQKGALLVPIEFTSVNVLLLSRSTPKMGHTEEAFKNGLQIQSGSLGFTFAFTFKMNHGWFHLSAWLFGAWAEG